MVSKKIGLAGKSGSGKDAVADHICQRYGYHKIAVADGIRDECSAFLRQTLYSNIPIPNAEYGIAEHLGFLEVVDALEAMIWEKPTPSGIRVLLQFWGTEFRRSGDSMYWVKRLAERLSDPDEFLVVSDVRTPDEAAALRNAGGTVWFVERSGIKPVGLPNHFTEVALDGAQFDHTISNDGSLTDLQAKVDWLFHET